MTPAAPSVSAGEHGLPWACVVSRPCCVLGKTQPRRIQSWQVVQQFCSEGSHLMPHRCTL